MLKSTDTFGTFLLQDGRVPPSSPRVRPIKPETGEDRDQFALFDEHYLAYRQAKEAGRAERVGKYYRRLNEDVDMRPVLEFLINELADQLFFKVERHYGAVTIENHLCKEYIELDAKNGLRLKTAFHFRDETRLTHCGYLDAFDALAMQFQCDIVLQTARPEGTDYASHIHLFHPNGWSAEGFIGKSFEEIHAEVKKADGQAVVPNPTKFAVGLTQMKGMVERVGALSWRRDTNLDRHPDSFGDDPYWTDEPLQELYLRWERQAVKGIPASSSFLFSIHTCFADLADPRYTALALQAIENVHPDAYHSEILADRKGQFLEFLNRKKAESEAQG